MTNTSPGSSQVPLSPWAPCCRDWRSPWQPVWSHWLLFEVKKKTKKLKIKGNIWLNPVIWPWSARNLNLISNINFVKTSLFQLGLAYIIFFLNFWVNWNKQRGKNVKISPIKHELCDTLISCVFFSSTDPNLYNFHSGHVCVCQVTSVVSDYLWLHELPQASLPMGFSGQDYWIGLPLPTPEDLPWLRDWTHISCVSCIGRWVLYH